MMDSPVAFQTRVEKRKLDPAATRHEQVSGFFRTTDRTYPPSTTILMPGSSGTSAYRISERSTTYFTNKLIGRVTLNYNGL